MICLLAVKIPLRSKLGCLAEQSQLFHLVFVCQGVTNRHFPITSIANFFVSFPLPLQFSHEIESCKQKLFLEIFTDKINTGMDRLMTCKHVAELH